jgi:peptide/nickel transport system ATP-binding protein/oligopeptide transport system ATP-binding protein
MNLLALFAGAPKDTTVKADTSSKPMNLLVELQAEMQVAYVFISHDLGVVRHVADEVMVMYLGRAVETGPRAALFGDPQHPYTQALLSAAPMADPKAERKRKRIILEGDVPSPLNPPTGCRFRTRCPKAQDICASEMPELEDKGQGHAVACHFPEAVQII